MISPRSHSYPTTSLYSKCSFTHRSTPTQLGTLISFKRMKHSGRIIGEPLYDETKANMAATTTFIFQMPLK